MMSLPEQIQELEKIFDHLHDECAEQFGDNHEVTISALKGAARSFGLYCDFLRIQSGEKDD